MQSIPESFAAHIIHIYGSKGELWLDQLPDLIQEAAENWSLQINRVLQPLNYNFLAAGTRSGEQPVILKAGIPTRELQTEIMALQHYQGSGAVRLLEANTEQGLLLLEQVIPGFQLKSIDDDPRQVQAAADVIRKLHQNPCNPPQEYPSLQDWCLGFERVKEIIDPDQNSRLAGHLPKAEVLSQKILSEKSRTYLLHGDLHHENILFSDTAGWTAVDPKGVIGESAAEPAAFLVNPYPYLISEMDLPGLMSDRIANFSNLLDLDPDRVRGWGYLRAVLSAVWSWEERRPESISYFLTCADALLV
jgi:streptomycin 6-kinase